MKKQFTGTIVSDDHTSACGVALPFHPKEVFGKVRAPVRVTIRGFTFRTTVAAMGGEYWIGLNRANREGAGVAAGQKVKVIVELDDEPRVIEAPEDFAAALAKNKAANAAWSRLSFTHRREHVEAILEAKKPETRQRRIAAAIHMLAGGRARRPDARI